MDRGWLEDGRLSADKKVAAPSVFLLQRGTFYALGVNWHGTEGASLAVFVSDGDNRFTRVIEDYWYRAPV